MMSNGQELPKGWVWTNLGAVCDKIQDGTHFSPQLQYSEPGPGRYLYVTAKNIKPNGLDLSDVTYVDEAFHRPVYERCNPEFEDVLLIKDGVKTGIAAMNSIGAEFTLLSSVALLKPYRPVLDSFYLKHYLNSPKAFHMITGQMTGTAIKRIILERIRTAPIPLPPLAEQRRIVSKIEELFSDLDAGEAALRKVQKLLATYRQSVLKAAVTGELTREWRAEHRHRLEPGDALLRRILAARREQWQGRGTYQDPKAPDTTGLPALPEGWVWATVSQVGQVRLGRQRAPQHHTGKHMRPYLRAANVTWGGIDITDVLEMNFTPQEFDNYRLQRDDILLSEASGSPSEVGKPAIWNNELSECCFQNTLIRIRSQGPLPRFLYFHFLYCAISGIFGQIAKGIGIHHLGAERLAEMPIPIAPLAEQQHIVSEIERMLSLEEALETTVTESFGKTQSLRQSILKAAFSGKLVPQDPADEPASVLLERIRADRNGAPTAKGRRAAGAPQ